MTQKSNTVSSSNGLAILMPILLIIVVLFTAWPLILFLIVLLGINKVYQGYMWSMESPKINPIFQVIIKTKNGYITIQDLSAIASISQDKAKWYLDNKAQELGSSKIDKQTYYFLTSNSLAGLFDDTEPEPLYSKEPITSVQAFVTDYVEQPLVQEFDDTDALADITLPPSSIFPEEPAKTPTQPISAKWIGEILDDSEPDGTHNNPNQIPTSLIQSELARRLEVHSSTVLKRRTDPDFPDWSKSKDPQGIAWKFLRRTRTFVPILDS